MTRRGEIYLVSFEPARGFEQGGIRPALVVQNDMGNEYASTTIVAALTSHHREDYPFRVLVGPKKSGLAQPSSVMLDQLRTITMERLGRKVGELGHDVMAEVDEALHYSLGLIH